MSGVPWGAPEGRHVYVNVQGGVRLPSCAPHVQQQIGQGRTPSLRAPFPLLWPLLLPNPDAICFHCSEQSHRGVPTDCSDSPSLSPFPFSSGLRGRKTPGPK